MLLSCNYNSLYHIWIDFYCQDVKGQDVTYVSTGRCRGINFFDSHSQSRLVFTINPPACFRGLYHGVSHHAGIISILECSAFRTNFLFIYNTIQ